MGEGNVDLREMGNRLGSAEYHDSKAGVDDELISHIRFEGDFAFDLVSGGFSH